MVFDHYRQRLHIIAAVSCGYGVGAGDSDGYGIMGRKRSVYDWPLKARSSSLGQGDDGLAVIELDWRWDCCSWAPVARRIGVVAVSEFEKNLES